MKVGNVEMRSSKARCVDFSIVEKYKEITMDEKKKFIWFVLRYVVIQISQTILSAWTGRGAMSGFGG